MRYKHIKLDFIQWLLSCDYSELLFSFSIPMETSNLSTEQKNCFHFSKMGLKYQFEKFFLG